MGYRKVVQYGNITEIYDYEKDIKPTKATRKKKLRLYKNRIYYAIYGTPAKNKRESFSQRQKRLNLYERTRRSINRSRVSFFRLCHHNNINSKTIFFITLTFAIDLTYEKANQHLKTFIKRATTNITKTPIRYISVPELTKKGRFHYHLLVYDLPPKTAELERATRNFQMQFQRGFVDVSLATYTSEGIAGYMAKYLAKAFGFSKTKTIRGYTCSRNIKKITSTGSNSLSGYSDHIIPDVNILDIQKTQYPVPYLKSCVFTKITKKL